MKIAALVVLLFSLVLPSTANAADWQLVGSWKLKVTCKNFTQVNTVSVSEASASRVRGTTNVNDGFGKIVAGKFDGENFIFANQYKWEGRTYTEQWQGKLSKGGRYLQGKFSTDNAQGGGCSFKGPRP